MSARLLLIDNYDSFTYNLVQAFLVLEAEVLVYRNDALSVADAEKLQPTHLVISPGPGRPDDAGSSLAMIGAFAGKIPVLGVCLGHQAIGEAQLYANKAGGVMMSVAVEEMLHMSLSSNILWAMGVAPDRWLAFMDTATQGHYFLLDDHGRTIASFNAPVPEVRTVQRAGLIAAPDVQRLLFSAPAHSSFAVRTTICILFLLTFASGGLLLLRREIMDRAWRWQRDCSECLQRW